MKLLVHAGADPNLLGDKGTALHHAAEGSEGEYIE